MSRLESPRYFCCSPSRPTRRLSAVCDPWQVTVVNGDRQTQRGNPAGTPLNIYKEHQRGKVRKNVCNGSYVHRRVRNVIDWGAFAALSGPDAGLPVGGASILFLQFAEFTQARVGRLWRDPSLRRH